jgi:hypothetical protein
LSPHALATVMPRQIGSSSFMIAQHRVAGLQPH